MTPLPDTILPPDRDPESDEAAMVSAISNAIMAAGMAGEWGLVDWLWQVLEEFY